MFSEGQGMWKVPKKEKAEALRALALAPAAKNAGGWVSAAVHEALCITAAEGTTAVLTMYKTQKQKIEENQMKKNLLINLTLVQKNKYIISQTQKHFITGVLFLF